MTEIIPRLFIGNWHEARSAAGMHVITCASDSEFTGHEKFGLIDGPGNDCELYVRAVDAVCKAHGSGTMVLVHCVGGRSRSAAVVVGAMMKIMSRPMCEMYDLLLTKHDQTRIHPYLAEFLTENGK